MQLPRRQTLVRLLIVFTRENKLICLFVVITGAGSKGRCSLSCRFPLADLLTCTKCSGRHHHVCDGETISLNICKKCSGIETTINTHETPHKSNSQAPQKNNWHQTFKRTHWNKSKTNHITLTCMPCFMQIKCQVQERPNSPTHGNPNRELQRKKTVESRNRKNKPFIH